MVDYRNEEEVPVIREIQSLASPGAAQRPDGNPRRRQEPRYARRRPSRQPQEPEEHDRRNVEDELPLVGSRLNVTA